MQICGNRPEFGVAQLMPLLYRRRFDMVAARLACLVLAAGLLVPPDALAQGRGNGRNKDKGAGNGPAFCRSGAGHPVHGRAWCREKGWDRDSSFLDSITDRDERARRRAEQRERERNRDRRDDGGWWPF